MSKSIKTRKGNDGFNYPYTSPDLVIDKNGKSVTAKFNEIVKKTITDDERNKLTNLNNYDDTEIKKELNEKANKNEIFTMANMGQDIKEAMTGGSVAVIGKNAILTENIVDKQVTPEKTSFFKVNVNLADEIKKISKKTIDIVKGLYDIKDTEDENQYVTDYIDISNIPTNKMIIIRGLNKGKFLRYDENKSLITGSKDNNRVYYKEENVKYVRIGNTFDSNIETEVYALGENAEEWFSDEYDKYKGLFNNDDNIFNYEKAVFGYWFNGTTLTYAFSPANMFIYGYIDITGKDEIYLHHNSAEYKTFNIGFYDINYNLIKVVKSKTYYQISKDSDLVNAKYIIIGSTNNYESRDKKQLIDVVVSFKEPVGLPKQKMINPAFIDERKFIKNGWYGQICDSLGDSLTEFGYFQEDIKNKLGLLAFDNHGIGGSTMLGTNTSSMNNDARINLLNPNAKLITVMAGTNDYAAIFNSKTHVIGEVSLSNEDINTYVGAYNTCIKKIYDKYNNDIQIIIMTPLFNPQHNEENFLQLVDTCIEIAKLWNIKCIDLHRIGLNNYNADKWWTQDDRVHPTRECYTKMISPVICASIRNLEPI